MTANQARPATSGLSVVVLNLNDHSSSGAQLSQTFGTTRGQRYGLAFDLGTVGAVGDQVMQVTVQRRRYCSIRP